MKVISHSISSIDEHLETFVTACKEAGLRVTNQRIEIYHELAMASDHPSAETLHQRLLLKNPTLALDTVYRSLATFARHGLINKVETVESQARFEATGMRHHHIICSKCSKIMDFIWQEVDSAPLPDKVGEWGRIDTRNIVIYGVCRDCL